MFDWRYVVMALSAYLLGSIPVGYLVVHWLRGVDIRAQGSGNIGTVNVSRVAGYPVAALVFVLDAFKGAWPVLLLHSVDFPYTLGLVGSAAAILGHNFSIFLHFKGGKGVATTMGALLAIQPWAALAGGGIWLLTCAVWRYASLSSLLMLFSIPIWLYVMEASLPSIFFAIGAALLAVYQHRANIARLRAGTELRLFSSSEGSTDSSGRSHR